MELGAGVAAAEVCDAQIRAEKIRPVAQQLRIVELGGNLVIPFVYKEAQLGMRSLVRH
jgi:hypothetical protein